MVTYRTRTGGDTFTPDFVPQIENGEKVDGFYFVVRDLTQFKEAEERKRFSESWSKHPMGWYL